MNPRIDGAALDRYITGNYGQDQFTDEDEDEKPEPEFDEDDAYERWKERDW